MDRTERRPGAADIGAAARLPAARQRHAGDRPAADRDESRLSSRRLPAADRQSLGGAQRRIVLRPFRAAALLSGDRRQQLGFPGPRGRRRARSPGCRTRWRPHWNGTFYQSLLPAPGGYDPNIDIVLRPSTEPSRPPTRSCSRPRPLCAASGPTAARRRSTRSTEPMRGRGFGPLFGPLSRRRLRRRHPGSRARRTSVGAVHLRRSPSCTTCLRPRSPRAERSRSTACQRLLRPDRGQRRERLPRSRRPRCRPPATGCSRRSSFTATTSS